MPGLPGTVDSVLRGGVSRGFFDGIPGNAGLTPIAKRTGKRVRGGNFN